LSDVPVPVKPTNILKSIVPAYPATFGELTRPYRLQAEAHWNSIWAVGADAYHTEGDAFIIERYVSLQVRRSKLMAMIEIDGWMTEGSQGQSVANPVARLLLDIEGKLPGLEDRLGLNPEARLRLGLAAAETKSKLDSFREDIDE